MSLSSVIFSATTGWRGPRTGPSSFTRSQPFAIHVLYRSNPATLSPYEPLTSKVQLPSRSRSFGPSDAVTTEHRLNFSRISRVKGNGTRFASVKRKSEKLSLISFPQAIDLAPFV